VSRVAIIAALPGELKPLVANGTWRRSESGTSGSAASRPNVWTGSVAGHEAVAVAGGIGAAAAAHAVDLALSHGPADALISCGWAGAITCAVKPPDAFAISEIVDHSTGERFATQSPEGLRLITLDHVAGINEKRPLAEAHKAVLVDMEAAAVARLAAQRGIPFYCFKSISDAYTDRLPDFNRFITSDGRLRLPAFIGHAAIRPVYWPSLVRLAGNSARAAVNLAQLLSKSIPAKL
jgi:adenosylhomocysteine nucleosidase